MRVVLDTNILARGHQLAHGPARRVLRVVTATPNVLILSPYLLQELQRILVYPRLLKRSGLTSSDIAEYMEYLARAATVVDPIAVPVDLFRDPTDGPVLGTALGGRADVICTRDGDFFVENVRQFSIARGIRILTDLEMLRSLL